MVTIETNKKTVWINSVDRCLARFCCVSQEYLKTENDFAFEYKLHTKMKPTKKDWESFCKEVFIRFKIYIPENIMPKYLAV